VRDQVVPVDLATLLSPVMAITEHGLRMLIQQVRQFSAVGATGLAAPRRPSTSGGIRGVRRIPVAGYITYRSNFLSSIFGWSTVIGIQAELDEALADPSVSAILLDIDSPGGTVYGIEELAASIFAARSQKRIVAHAAPFAASAAYWLGAEAKAYVLEQLGIYHRKFTGAIARFRGVSQATVESRFGQGRTVLASQAVGLGMIDGLAASAGEFLAQRPGQARSVSSAHAKIVAMAEAEISIARARAS